MQNDRKALQEKLKALQSKIDKKKHPRLFSEATDMTSLAAKLDRVKGNDLNAFLEVLALIDYLTDDWYSFGQYVQIWDTDALCGLEYLQPALRPVLQRL